MDSTEGPDQPGKPADIKHPEAGRGLDAVWERLIKLERSVPGQLRNLPAQVGKEAVPAWRRVTAGEARWQVSLAVAAAILLQLPVSGRLALVRPAWLLPVLEALVAIGLIIANPRRIDRQSVMLRYAGDAPADQEGGRLDACPGRGEQQDEHDDRARGHAGQQTEQHYGDHQAHRVSRCPVRCLTIVSRPLAGPAG